MQVLQSEFAARYTEYEVIDQSGHVIIIKPKHDTGGLVRVITDQGIGKTVRMRFNEDWVQVSSQLFHGIREAYGKNFLQHKHDGKSIKCSQKSNACLPDFSTLRKGRAGIWKEHFTE